MDKKLNAKLEALSKNLKKFAQKWTEIEKNRMLSELKKKAEEVNVDKKPTTEV